jgi:hypothetical protein
MAIIDSGSEMSTISMNLIKGTDVQNQLLPNYAELEVFGDKIITSNYQVSLFIKCEEMPKEMELTCLIQPSGEPMLILGQNFLRMHNLNIDLQNTQLSQYTLRTSANAPKCEFKSPLYAVFKEQSRSHMCRGDFQRFSVP